MRNAYKSLLIRGYNRFRVWRYDTSVPWPMALGSCGARLVCMLFGTARDTTTSVQIVNMYLTHFEVTHHFLHSADQKMLHTRIRFLMENET